MLIRFRDKLVNVLRLRFQNKWLCARVSNYALLMDWDRSSILKEPTSIWSTQAEPISLELHVWIAILLSLEDDHTTFLYTNGGPPEENLKTMPLRNVPPFKDSCLSFFLWQPQELRSHLAEADVFHHSGSWHWTCDLHIKLLGSSGRLYTITRTCARTIWAFLPFRWSVLFPMCARS